MGPHPAADARQFPNDRQHPRHLTVKVLVIPVSNANYRVPDKHEWP